MWLARLSIFLHVATSTTDSAIAGTITHATSLRREAAGTSSDFAADSAAKVDRKIAISATMQAAAAIQKIVSASG
jgi:hypothetical protein